MTRLKALLVAAGGIPVCAAILSGLVVIGLDHLVSDDPVPDVLVGALVFGTGALIVLLIAGRASWRAYRGGGGEGPMRWLAFAVPVLAIVGAGFGVWFTWRIVNDHHTYSEAEASRICAVALDQTASAADRSRCIPIARRCERLVRENPPRASRGMTDTVDPSLEGVSLRDAAVIRCLRERGAHGG